MNKTNLKLLFTFSPGRVGVELRQGCMLEGLALGWSAVGVPFLPQLVLAGVQRSVRVVALKIVQHFKVILIIINLTDVCY